MPRNRNSNPVTGLEYAEFKAKVMGNAKGYAVDLRKVINVRRYPHRKRGIQSTLLCSQKPEQLAQSTFRHFTSPIALPRSERILAVPAADFAIIESKALF